MQSYLILLQENDVENKYVRLDTGSMQQNTTNVEEEQRAQVLV